MSDLILVERDGAIATVVLNRPHKLNALIRAMWGELGDTVWSLSQERAVRCIVLRGAGEKVNREFFSAFLWIFSRIVRYIGDMNLHPIDLAIIAIYLVAVGSIGFIVKKRATKRLDSYFLADRNVPWWMLGLSGCSSYIDIGGTMSMIGAHFYLGLKSLWATHIFWGWFMISFYMAFQAKWIRRSGVMTFAEWNETRFGPGRDTEAARLAAGSFLLVLIICNLMFISVGTGKFAEEFLPLTRWEATLIVSRS